MVRFATSGTHGAVRCGYACMFMYVRYYPGEKECVCGKYSTF